MELTPTPEIFNAASGIINYNIATVFRMAMHEIDLEPPYQRDVVWIADKQSSLINSLICNYPIQPILLSRRNVEDVGEGVRTLVCMDGKQRLTSIMLFMKNEIPVSLACGDSIGWFYYSALPVKKSTKTRVSILPAKYKLTFDDCAIGIITYSNITLDQEYAIFGRIQYGEALKPAEKRRAKNGPYSKLTRHLLEKYDWIKRFEPGNRANADEFALRIICYIGVGMTAPSSTALTRAVEASDVPMNKAEAEKFGNILRRFTEMLNAGLLVCSTAVDVLVGLRVIKKYHEVMEDRDLVHHVNSEVAYCTEMGFVSTRNWQFCGLEAHLATLAVLPLHQK